MVISTCAACGSSNALPGVQRGCRPEADAAEMRSFRKTVQKNSRRQVGGDGNGKGDAEDKALVSKKSRGGEKKSTPGTKSTNKKKRKRRTLGRGNDDDRGTPRPKSGLATSFLFEPV